MPFDLLLKGGRVVDPSQSLDAPADVALAGGRIAALAPDIPAEASSAVLDVAGKLVVPGLIDLHTHVYAGVTTLSVEADRDCLAKGVTTVVDAGTTGAYTIEGFRRFIVAPSQARVLAYLNISSIGLPIDDIDMAELGWLPLVNVSAAVAAIEKYREIVVGIKVRMGKEVVWDNGIQPLLLARQAAERAGVPLMVHIGDSPVPLGDILDLMRPGDILTHAYTAFGGLDIAPDRSSYRVKPFQAKGSGTTLLDAAGRVIPEAWAARQRGVLFDIGHGGGSFSYEVFDAAMQQGLYPDTISTDLHAGSIKGPVYDMPTLMSRFLSLGLSLSQVIEASACRPAQALGMAGHIGTLSPGAAGDVAVLDLLEGDFEYLDSTRAALRSPYRLAPYLTVKAGQVVGRA